MGSFALQRLLRIQSSLLPVKWYVKLKSLMQKVRKAVVMRLEVVTRVGRGEYIIPGTIRLQTKLVLKIFTDFHLKFYLNMLCPLIFSKCTDLSAFSIPTVTWIL